MWLIIAILCSLGISNGATARVYDLGGIISGNTIAGVPLGPSYGEGEADVEGVCSKPGMACQNCTNSVWCVPLPNGWLKMPLQTCQEGTTCNAHLGECSSKAVPECNAEYLKYTHSCEQVGIFPDPYDCRMFHMCVTAADFPPEARRAERRTAFCPRHYGYNAQIAQCSIKLTNGQCQDAPLPKCVKNGDTGPFPSSLNHYFVCLWRYDGLYPQIFLCPNGWYFWDGLCRPEQRPPATIVDNEQSTAPNKASTIATTTDDVKTLNIFEGFFSTEKPTTNTPDTFLADRFNFVDNKQTPGDFVFYNSYESDSDDNYRK